MPRERSSVPFRQTSGGGCWLARHPCWWPGIQTPGSPGSSPFAAERASRHQKQTETRWQFRQLPPRERRSEMPAGAIVATSSGD